MAALSPSHLPSLLPLLRRMRQVMAEEGTVFEKLQVSLEIIVKELPTASCCLYLIQPGEMLKLIAWWGGGEAPTKNQQYFFFGSEIIGKVAADKTCCVIQKNDMQALGNWIWGNYQTILAVPMIRAGTCQGVLAVLDDQPRHYLAEEIEILQILGTIFTELVAPHPEYTEPPAHAETAVVPSRIQGVGLSPGLEIGYVFHYQPKTLLPDRTSANPQVETKRLIQAITDLQNSLHQLCLSEQLQVSGHHHELLEVYKSITQDQGWIKRMVDAIRSGLSAEMAVMKVKNDIQAKIRPPASGNWQDIVLDMDDLSNRLLAFLREDISQLLPNNTDDVIILAPQISASELLYWDHKRLKGLILGQGNAMSHAVVIARALNIPVLVSTLPSHMQIKSGEKVILDADHHQAFFRPNHTILKTVTLTIQNRRQNRPVPENCQPTPAISQDGVPVDIWMNAGLLLDMPTFQNSGAVGVGLFRTELTFMTQNALPSVPQQKDIYQKILHYAQEKPVIFRTLDVGGDKLLPYWQRHSEPNPAMGWRAIRMSLDRPFLLRSQLKALIAAASGHDLHVMFPMVGLVQEYLEAKEFLQIEWEMAKQRQQSMPKTLKIGVMLETPALAFQLEHLLPHIDFLSIGSNDLWQFLSASDRDNPMIADRYDILSPGFMNFLKPIVKSCAQANVPINLCGEMASNPIDAIALIAIGFRKLSMTASAIPLVKEVVQRISVVAVQEFVEQLLKQHHPTLRPFLRDYARDHQLLAGASENIAIDK